MPIPDDLKDAYPDDWDAIRDRVMERATIDDARADGPTPCCEWCGVPQGEQVTRYDDTSTVWREEEDEILGRVGVRVGLDADGDLDGQMHDTTIVIPSDTTTVVLTTAHLCQDPRCSDLDHLRALCQRCHLTYNARRDQKAKRETIQAEIRGQQRIGPPAGCPAVVGEDTDE